MFKKGLKKANKWVVRLHRRGHIRYASYDIVVALQNNSSGGFVERIGFYNPGLNERSLSIDTVRLSFWLKHGAIVKHSVKKYLCKFTPAYVKNA